MLQIRRGVLNNLDHVLSQVFWNRHNGVFEINENALKFSWLRMFSLGQCIACAALG